MVVPLSLIPSLIATALASGLPESQILRDRPSAASRSHNTAVLPSLEAFMEKSSS